MTTYTVVTRETGRLLAGNCSRAEAVHWAPLGERSAAFALLESLDEPGDTVTLGHVTVIRDA